eukprot:gene42042-52114_t
MDRRASLALSLFIVVVALPAYIALTKFHGTYYHEFAWQVSAVFLSGTVQSTLEQSDYSSTTQNAGGADVERTRSLSTDCSSGANITKSVQDDDSTSSDMSVVSRMTVELFIVLFNNLAATFIASAIFMTTSTTSYTPPFIYNYECTSFIITSYANIYVYIVANILLPKLLRPIDQLIESCHLPQDGTVTITTYRQALHLLFFPPAERDSILDMHQFTAQIIQSISIILTFGAVVPPL